MVAKLRERLKQLQSACEVQSTEMTSLATEKARLHDDRKGLKQKLKELDETIDDLKVVESECSSL